MAESTNSSGKAAEISGGVGASREWGRGRTGGGKQRSGFQRSKRVGSGRNRGGGGAKGRKARKKGARFGDARNGVREVWTPCPPHYFSDLDVLFVCVIFWDKYRNFTYVTLTRFL